MSRARKTLGRAVGVHHREAWPCEPPNANRTWGEPSPEWRSLKGSGYLGRCCR